MIAYLEKLKTKLESKLPKNISSLSGEVTEPSRSVEVKTVSEIIAEIHETFYTEVDRLLVESNISYSLETQKQQLIEKAEELEKLGFGATKEVEEAETEKRRIINLELKNYRNERLNRAIHYFTFKYPHYKFITEESVKRICEKYNLVYGIVSLYTGTVPDINLKHIQEFEIKEEDECYTAIYTDSNYNSDIFGYYNLISAQSLVVMHRPQDIRYKSAKEIKFPSIFRATSFFTQKGVYVNSGEVHIKKSKLEIAAPASDFNMSRHELNNFKISEIEIPDPVVLQPVVYESEKYYLIVTAWGDEAHDPLVQNANLN